MRRGCDTKLLLSKRLNTLRFLAVFTFISFLLLFLDGKEDQRKVEEQIGDTSVQLQNLKRDFFYELIKLSSFLFVS